VFRPCSGSVALPWAFSIANGERRSGVIVMEIENGVFTAEKLSGDAQILSLEELF